MYTLCILFSSTHLSASTFRIVPAKIMTCQCFLSPANSFVIWFLAISSFTRSRHLSFGLPRFLFPSTVICNVFIMSSFFYNYSLSRLCTCPNHLSIFSLRNTAFWTCVSLSIWLHFSRLVFPLANRNMRISV